MYMDLINKITEFFSPFEQLIELHGINASSKSGKNRLSEIISTYESPIAKKLVFSKLKDTIMSKYLLTRTLRRELMDRVQKCLKGKY
jgi:hypothetical protein